VYNGVLGYNWTHNYNLSLSGETNGNVMFFDGDLASYRFLSNGTGGFLYNPGIRATLASSGTEYILQYDSGKQYTFSASKKVSKIRDIHGNSLSFTYTGVYLS
jgi:hypothetical protein